MKMDQKYLEKKNNVWFFGKSIKAEIQVKKEVPHVVNLASLQPKNS